jgi:hypothetical protein
MLLGNFYDFEKAQQEFNYSTMVIFGQPGLGKSLLVHEIRNKISGDMKPSNLDTS